MVMNALIDADLAALQEMRDAVQAAKKAQSVFEEFTQEQIDRIVKAISEAALGQAEQLGRLAVEETGLGVPAHKAMKNAFAARDVYESIKDQKTVGILREDRDKGVVEVAHPFGVICGIIPVTNPTSTVIFKSLIALKARNAIVFSPHPSAVRCSMEAARICAEAAEAAGAPKGIIGCLSKPTLELTEALMKHPNVSLILSTGGGGLVKAAYSSGKPAYGVGPGNVPAYIERTANIPQAVEHILQSKTFDYGTICASEQAIVVDQSVKERVVRECKNRGAYFLNEQEKRELEKLISSTPGKLNPKIVGKSAHVIAGLAGIEVPPQTTVLIAEESNIGKDVPFAIEKLSPILAMYSVNDWVEGCQTCIELLNLGGLGHTLVLHSSDEQVIREFALHKPVSRILVNTPAALGAIGATTYLRPSMTLGCGTFGGNITSDNLAPEHLMNIKRLAYGKKPFKMPEYTNGDVQSLDEQVREVVYEMVSKQSGGTQLDVEQIHRLVNDVIEQLQQATADK